ELASGHRPPASKQPRPFRRSHAGGEFPSRANQRTARTIASAPPSRLAMFRDCLPTAARVVIGTAASVEKLLNHHWVAPQGPQRRAVPAAAGRAVAGGRAVVVDVRPPGRDRYRCDGAQAGAGGDAVRGEGGVSPGWHTRSGYRGYPYWKSVVSLMGRMEDGE